MFRLGIERIMMRGVSKILAYLFSLFPVEDNMILLEGNRSYDDSARALFEEMLELELNKQFRIFWAMENANEWGRLTEFKNVEVVSCAGSYSRLSDLLRLVKIRWVGARARYSIYCNEQFGCRKTNGQLKVYLTHGMPIKNCKGKLGRIDDNLECATSPYTARLLSKATSLGEEKIIVTNLPRNDTLYKGSLDTKGDRLPDFLLPYRHMKKIVWMPTFKHLGAIGRRPTRNDYNDAKHTDLPLMTSAFIQKLSNVLEKEDCVLFIKYHPFQDLSYVPQLNYPNIITLTSADFERAGLCLYHVLGYFDALITDFSSVGIDWLMLDRPIAYDISDMDEYQNGIGFITENPLELMPGKLIKSESDFFGFICDVTSGNDAFDGKRKIARRKLHTYIDDKSSMRVLKAIGII